jgi:hypothetical protein
MCEQNTAKSNAAYATAVTVQNYCTTARKAEGRLAYGIELRQPSVMMSTGQAFSPACRYLERKTW